MTLWKHMHILCCLTNAIWFYKSKQLFSQLMLVCAKRIHTNYYLKTRMEENRFMHTICDFGLNCLNYPLFHLYFEFEVFYHQHQPKRTVTVFSKIYFPFLLKHSAKYFFSSSFYKSHSPTICQIITTFFFFCYCFLSLAHCPYTHSIRMFSFILFFFFACAVHR